MKKVMLFPCRGAKEEGEANRAQSRARTSFAEVRRRKTMSNLNPETNKFVGSI